MFRERMIALNTDLEIWPTPPLVFTQGVKVQNFAFETLWFETKQRIAYLL